MKFPVTKIERPNHSVWPYPTRQLEKLRNQTLKLWGRLSWLRQGVNRFLLIVPIKHTDSSRRCMHDRPAMHNRPAMHDRPAVHDRAATARERSFVQFNNSTHRLPRRNAHRRLEVPKMFGQKKSRRQCRRLFRFYCTVRELTGQKELVHATRIAFVVRSENATYAAFTFGAWCPVILWTPH